jgi:hypothetical protein
MKAAQHSVLRKRKPLASFNSIFQYILQMTTQFTYEQAIKAVRATQQLHDKTGAFFNSQGLEPKIDSLAVRELQTFERSESLWTAYSQGNSLIELAADHLIAFTKAITEPAQSFAPWTMARAVLETSALSCWLLDTKITTHKRVGRSLALRYEGLVQENKFGQAAALPVETAKANARIEEVEAMAEGLGFAKLQGGKGERTGIGQVMPSVTEVIRATLNEEANYRLFSAMAHGHSWAYSQLGFRKAGETDLYGDKAFLMEKHLSIEAVLWLCSNVARYFAQPIKCRCELYGWDLVQFNGILDDVFREIGIRPDSGLWHSQQEDTG